MGKFAITKMAGDKIVMPGFFDTEAFLAGINYKAKPGQVYVATYPKCGTTWTQHIVLLIYNKGEPFKPDHFFKHSPFLEMAGPEMVETMELPGIIKTHLTYELTPQHPEAKYIYVARNPKDTSVSLFHHERNFPGYQFQDGRFEDFFQCFYSGEIEWGDYFDHIMGWYKHKNDPNVLFITFEFMKQNHAEAVKKIAAFLGPQYAQMLDKDPQILNNIVERSSVAYMKKHNDSQFTDMFSISPDVLKQDPNLSRGLKAALAGLLIDPESQRDFNFVRKGIVGDWKSLYTQEQSEMIDKKFESKFKGTELFEMFKGSKCSDKI